MSTAPIVLGQYRPYSDPHIPNPPRDTRVRINSGIIDLVDSAIIYTDASEGNIFRVTISGNRAFANPTNLVEGATYMWIIKEDGTGGYTPTFDTLFDFATAPSWATAANAVNVVSGVYEGGFLRVLHNKGW
jgi:hypothetical protein